jgi:toxin ParE1/3/4
MVIVWTGPARDDLRLIHQYIARDSRRYAARVVEDIADKVEVLRELPRLGRKVPELGEDAVRELPLYSYRILYEIKPAQIEILAVIHKRRDLQPEDIPRGP